jgi:hypothetical protein
MDSSSVSDAWDELLDRGFVHLRGAFSPSISHRLREDSKSLPLARAQRSVGAVDQRMMIAQIPYRLAPFAIQDFGAQLKLAIGDQLRESVGDGGDRWPNEVTLAHYDSMGGISAHRDQSRYRYLIAICSILGCGRIQVVQDREADKVLADFTVWSGDLVILGAPGLTDPPMHVVSTIVGPRTSISFRFDAKAPTPSWASESSDAQCASSQI